MKREQVVIKLGTWTFFVWDVRLVHTFEAEKKGAAGFKDYWLEVVLKDLPANVTFKFSSAEERDAASARIEGQVAAYHESKA